MSTVELHFGTISVIIRDKNTELKKMKSIAKETLLSLLPAAEKMLAKEKKKFINENREVYEECEEEENCSLDQTSGKCQDGIKHLYG